MSDLIDRQAVIDLLKQMRKDGDMVPWEGKDVFARIRKLPTIQPEKAQHFSEGTTKDTISRKPAIDALDKQIKQCCKALGSLSLSDVDKHAVEVEVASLRAYREMLENLPTAQPEPKEGHWILHESPDGGEQYECSRCGVLWEFNEGTPEDNEAYFCPKCGARMKGEQDGH